MSSEPAILFHCDSEDCDEYEYLADSEGSGPPMEWSGDEQADMHRCIGCTKELGELTYGSFRPETAALRRTARRWR